MYYKNITLLCKLKLRELYIGEYNVSTNLYLLVLDLGSRGPSTVTLMALLYVATCGGCVETVIVKVKLLPAINKERPLINFVLISLILLCMHTVW